MTEHQSAIVDGEEIPSRARPYLAIAGGLVSLLSLGGLIFSETSTFADLMSSVGLSAPAHSDVEKQSVRVSHSETSFSPISISAMAEPLPTKSVMVPASAPVTAQAVSPVQSKPSIADELMMAAKEAHDTNQWYEERKIAQVKADQRFALVMGTTKGAKVELASSALIATPTELSSTMLQTTSTESKRLADVDTKTKPNDMSVTGSPRDLMMTMTTQIPLLSASSPMDTMVKLDTAPVSAKPKFVTASATPSDSPNTATKQVSSGKWTIKSAANGVVNLERPEGGALQVHVGDMVPGLGMIGTYKQENGVYTLITSSGLISSGA